jgi:transposase
MTFMAALRHDRITAPWFIEGPINGETFLLYIEKVLVPTLRHGDIVIMDNLGSHKANAVRHASQTNGEANGQCKVMRSCSCTWRNSVHKFQECRIMMFRRQQQRNQNCRSI